MSERFHLLIVDDVAQNIQIVASMLKSDQYRLSFALSGAVALQLIEQQQFDLILSDYNLLDGSGIELMEKIHLRCDTPVIMVTGENVGHIAAEAISRGATDYIVKLGDYLFTIPLVVQKNLIVAKVKAENERLRRDLQAALNQVREKNVQLEESLKTVEHFVSCSTCNPASSAAWSLSVSMPVAKSVSLRLGLMKVVPLYRVKS